MRPASWLLPGALLLALAAPAAPSVRPPPRAPETVVLVHGLGRTPVSMLPLEWALERAGYRVVNWGYSSVSAGIPELGARLAAAVEAEREAHPRGAVHFVGHSLGGILIRWVLAYDQPEGVGRVVLLAPPNQGSRAADRYAPWIGWLLRPMPELTTAQGATARRLPAASGVEVGIIAARGDGKVSVAETRLTGARDHVVVPGGHTFVMARPGVHRLVARFLSTGTFRAEEPQPSEAARSAPFEAPRADQ